MAPSSSKLVDATLGIDLGSTSTRACLWVPSKRQEIHVENTAGIPSHAYLHPGDYPTVGFPFEPHGPVYLGGDVDPDRQATSLKYGFYPLAADEEDEELLKQYILVQPLMERKNDPIFCGRVRQGLVELLTNVNRDVQATCQMNGLQITRIGLSIPAQWTLEFEDVYQKIVTEVFGRTKENIFFHTETEALAHFLLQNFRDELQVREGEDYGVFLFLDFGGHNMNGCIFNLVQGEKDENPSFYRIGDAFGVGGGSEHWTYSIGQKMLFYMRQDKGEPISPEQEQDMLHSFNSKKGRLGPSQAKASAPFRFGSFQSFLPAAEVAECFEEGHREVFAMAKDQIEHISKFRAVPLVVVSGGTANHSGVQSRLRSFCDAAGVPEPWFVKPPGSNYSTGRIAHGVAMAASNCLTIPQFMERGAAFGLQKRPCPNRGNTNPDKQWEDTAKFLLSENEQKTYSFDTRGNDEYKIICDPFFEAHPSEHLQFDRCYDILYLGKSKPGFWSIAVSLVSSNGSTSFVIKTTWEQNGGRRKKRTGPFTPQDHDQTVEKQSPPLAMSFDGGTNCAYVDLDGYDIKKLDFGVERLERDNKAIGKETADTKPRGHHGMLTRGGHREAPRPDNAEMVLPEPRKPAVVSYSASLHNGSEPAPCPEALLPTRMHLPTGTREMRPPTPRRDSAVSASRLSAPTSSDVQVSQAPKIPASDSIFKAPGRSNSRPPYAFESPPTALRYSALAPNKLPSPQRFERPMLGSSSNFAQSSKTFSSQNPTPERSGREKPNPKREFANKLYPYANKIHKPSQESKHSSVHRTSQLQRERKVWVLSDTEDEEV